MKVSVIIPVYNVEPYLSKCLESIVNQDLSQNEYEIIVINDGSKDKCGDIITQFKSSYSNVIYVEQENKGVSAARNRGLDLARGEFVTFIDGDDTIYKNSLKSIIDRALNDELDLLYLSLEKFSKNGEYLGLAEGNGSETLIASGLNYPRRTYASTLYKRKIIGKIRFVEGIIFGEDTVFNAMVQSKAVRCSYFSKPYYKYLIRENSSRENSFTNKAFEGFLLAIEFLSNYKKNNFPEQKNNEKEYFDKVFLIFIQRTLELSILPKLDRKRFKILKEKLKGENLEYLMLVISKDFKLFNKPFLQFYIYNSIKKSYYKILSILSKIKRKLIII